MNIRILKEEVKIKAVRSSGAGGQHVNKVSSKIILHFNVSGSHALTASEKAILKAKLASRISQDGNLILSCSQTRSQHKNKELCICRLVQVLQTQLIKPKIRKKTKPSRASHLKRLNTKKINSLKKASRKFRNWE